MARASLRFVLTAITAVARCMGWISMQIAGRSAVLKPPQRERQRHGFQAERFNRNSATAFSRAAIAGATYET